MALIAPPDRVLETSTTTGTGTYTLAGAMAGFRAASAACANGDTAYYYAEDVDVNGVPTGGYEIGIGTWATGNTLARTTIHTSSNANAAVSWAAGTRRISLSLTAAALANYVTKGSAFSARLNGSQTIAAAFTDTKIEFSAENYDTDNRYDTTLFRFTPPAGYYQVNCTIKIPAASGGGVLRIYKNGTFYRQIAQATTSAELTLSGGLTMYLNGTDYIEMWTYLYAAGSFVSGGSPDVSNFDAHFVRPT